MQKKDLILYVLLVLIGFIVIIGLFNSFRTSKNLKDATKNLREASQKVDESMVLIKDQRQIIDSIRNSNMRLLEDLIKMESGYDQLRGIINNRFSKTYDFLNSLEYQVNSLTTVQIDIE